MQPRTLITLALVLGPLAATAQPANIDWNAPFPPHRVMDNLYYVGSEQLATFLIVTPEGHILINSDFESTVPLLQRNVEALGFEFDDIEIVLGSHAHGDHMEADALVKELTGADVYAMAEDAPALLNMRPGGKEHPVDRVLEDGEEVMLGGETLTAHRTGGHTRGCTSWELEVEEGGNDYNALIICSFGVNPGYVLVNNPDYPDIADDYVATFARARAMNVDVFLAPHGSQYGLAAKHSALLARGPNDPNPFIDRPGYLAHIDAQEANFRRMLESQQGAAR